jgi:hypothetical protein
MKSKNQEKTRKTEKNQKTDDSSSIRIQPKIADDWELEDAVRTLARAEEIKQDEKMMGKIRPMLDKKVRSIEALKDLYNERYNRPSMDTDDQDGDDEDND